MDNPAQEQRENSGGPPPNLAPHCYPPGVSGNPGGRPKGRSPTALLREVLEEFDGDKAKVRKMVDTLVKLAIDGDRQAIKDIIERVDGKIADRLEVTEVPKGYDVGNSPEAL